MKFKEFCLNENDGKLSVGMVLFNDNKVLILKRGESAPWCPNLWSLAGGMVDEGETPLEAILREVYEETKINPNDVAYMKDYNNWHVFTGTTDYKQTDLEMENQQLDWVYKEELDDYDFVPDAKEAILEAFN